MGRWMTSRLFPRICLLCDQICSNDTGTDLCVHCHAALPWNVCCCSRCGVPMNLQHGVCTCSRCLASPPAFLRCVVPLRYEAAPRVWVRRMKFHQGLVEARLLGTLLADELRGCYSDEDLPDTLVPVPVSLRRLASRGHNQALSLASIVAHRLRRPVARRGVNRTRHGPAQRALSRAARQHNLKDAFASRPWRGERIAVVDDVMTTGATMQAMATTLLAAGASEVHAWCATRTPAAS